MLKYETKEVTEVREVLTELICDSCKTIIPFVFPNLPAEQGDYMLTITFDGGYGEYFDRIHGQPKIHLCRSCADDLRRASPVIEAALEVAAGPLPERPAV